jgi:hypothetical protein
MKAVNRAGQPVALAGGAWVVLRDPFTFDVRERRRLQRYLLELRGAPWPEAGDAEPPGPPAEAGLAGLLIGAWSLEHPLPAGPAAIAALTPPERRALREAILHELPGLQRAVHPSPGWTRR